MNDAFFFGIPLRSRAASKNWDRVSGLVRATLRSILNQRDLRWRAVVACHDVPDIAEIRDQRVIVVEVKIPTPTNSSEQMADKHHKRRAISAAVRREGGGYLMAVDADDLVSNRIVEFVRQDANPYGYIIDKGYEYDYGSGIVRYAPRFNRFCGSSGVFHFTVEDLPQDVDDPVASISDRFGNHTQWRKVAAEMRRPMATLPFCGAMYITNNGENHSVQSGNIGWRRSLLRMVTPARPMSAALRAEFGLDRCQ